MDVRRFGPGHRRPDGPPGTTGVSGQLIHRDDHSVVSELAFSRHAMVAPHSNPNTTLFIVISGGGFVQVGGERSRVNHGEAVMWPAGVPHGAYTEGTEMRAIVVELTGGQPGLLEGVARELPHGRQPGTPASGALADRPRLRSDYDSGEGEPW